MTDPQVEWIAGELRELRKELVHLVETVATKEDVTAALATASLDHKFTHENHLRIDHSRPRRLDDPNSVDMRVLRTPPVLEDPSTVNDRLQMIWAYRAVRWGVVATTAVVISEIVKTIHFPWE
jgi:hypothetical protein